MAETPICQFKIPNALEKAGNKELSVRGTTVDREGKCALWTTWVTVPLPESAADIAQATADAAAKVAEAAAATALALKGGGEEVAVVVEADPAGGTASDPAMLMVKEEEEEVAPVLPPAEVSDAAVAVEGGAEGGGGAVVEEGSSSVVSSDERMEALMARLLALEADKKERDERESGLVAKLEEAVGRAERAEAMLQAMEAEEEAAMEKVAPNVE
jgi:hypothetical protein